MTKGLTRLASHNSNIVATHKQSYDGGWAIYCTKKCWRKDKQALNKDISFFDQFLDDSFVTSNLSSASSVSTTSTGTKTSCTGIVKGIAWKSTPTMKAKPEYIDEDSICSDIMQDSVTLKTISIGEIYSEEESYWESGNVS